MIFFYGKIAHLIEVYHFYKYFNIFINICLLIKPRFLAPGATLVTYGGMSKQPLMVPAGPLIFNDVILRGFWMSRWTDENCGSDEQKEMIAWLTDLMIKGKFKVPDHEFRNINDFQNALKTSMEPYSNKKQIFLFDSV